MSGKNFRFKNAKGSIAYFVKHSAPKSQAHHNKEEGYHKRDTRG